MGLPPGGGGGMDPFTGVPPYFLAGGLPGGVEQFLPPFYAPGASTAQRRRLEGPAGGGAGAGGEVGGEVKAEGGEGGERGEGGAGGVGVGGRRTREPHVIGSAGWTRSIPCDFVEVRSG